MRLLPSLSRSYSPVGLSPLLLCDAKNKDYVSISGVISHKGGFYFEVREMEGFKGNGLTRFMTNAKKKLRKRLLMVWDNAPSHHSKVVKSYLSTQEKENPAIWLENIPPYSPELNPIEQLWGYLKKKLTNKFFKDTSELKKAVIKELEIIKKNKKLIISFFKNQELNCYQFFN